MLYDTNVDEDDRKIFLDGWLQFMTEAGQQATLYPAIEEKPVDIYVLYGLVNRHHGGFANVTMVSDPRRYRFSVSFNHIRIDYTK